MKNVEISVENARKAYKNATPEVKETLRELFGNDVLFDDITKIVTSYEAACEVTNTTPLTLNQFSFLPEDDREYHFADHQMTIIRKALNEGWTCKPSELGYYPVFKRPQYNGDPGFSYSYYYYYYYYDDGSNSDVGARRTYKTPELAIYAGKQFLSIQSKIHNEE